MLPRKAVNQLLVVDAPWTSADPVLAPALSVIPAITWLAVPPTAVAFIIARSLAATSGEIWRAAACCGRPATRMGCLNAPLWTVAVIEAMASGFIWTLPWPM